MGEHGGETGRASGGGGGQADRAAGGGIGSRFLLVRMEVVFSLAGYAKTVDDLHWAQACPLWHSSFPAGRIARN